ncbi:LysE/ArgO family amino acid transporter [Paracoccus sp. Z118]|uniref:LysE/ArgO family amino acid transporter n=1 Tax=Paracoccus sp. Z118 TaxID=2851017 RepID=UPI001C2CC405|nr:LysE/ArgO family amino acid transporter [Paracoccus sp. Z118]MBV0890973.1 LysE/ArgO family amino acid transporter [Paracoccus sp. Z118]
MPLLAPGLSPTTFLAGMGTGLSLIVAIGAQNAFVLKQGLRRQHVFAVCLFCALSDAVLIAAGVAGAGAIAARAPWFLSAMRWGGAAFLVWYGLRSFRAAWAGDEALRATGAAEPTLAATLATIAALTWLNPHVYLDTVVLLGAVSSGYEDKAAFALGGMSGSVLFFFSLGYGARLLAPLFARPAAWRVLDVAVGAVMWTIAAALILGG